MELEFRKGDGTYVFSIINNDEFPLCKNALEYIALSKDFVKKTVDDKVRFICVNDCGFKTTIFKTYLNVGDYVNVL